MITKKDLLEQGNSNNFNIQQLEIDYLQHIVLAALYNKPTNELIFKGGTALQKAYGSSRFSEDLDFDSNSANIKSFIENAIKNVKDYYDFNYTLKESPTSLAFNLKIKGPLFNGNDASIETIRIEVSRRDKILLGPEKNIITPLYKDLKQYELIVMKREEILAEKIRSLLYGDRARDVYDLWFLLKKGTKVEKVLINKKLNLYSKDKKLSDFDLAKEIEKERKKWSSEMPLLTKMLPPFDETKDTILTALK